MPGPSGETQRLFIAVPLGAAALEAVAGLVAALRAGDEAGRPAGPGGGGRPGLRWVRPEGLHLTLRFLGPTPRSRTDAATAALEDAARGLGPFVVRIAGAGAFPRLSAPRVLWLGIAEGADRLAHLAGRLDDRLVRAGWPAEDRPFDAHLTLARANDVVAARRVAAELVRRAGALDVAWTADRVVLYESWPGPGGSRYERVAVVPLAD
jgi:2'-5' RNA ligase